MAAYTIGKRPKRLREGDRVIFEVDGERYEYETMLSGAKTVWLAARVCGIFDALGIGGPEKIDLTDRAFGYKSDDYDAWPSSRPHDYAAQCRLVNAIYDLIEERGKKGAPEEDPRVPPAEHGIFLGYDWAPGSWSIDANALSHATPFSTLEDACNAAAEACLDSCQVFKVYAVDVKKYTRKFVQED